MNNTKNNDLKKSIQCLTFKVGEKEIISLPILMLDVTWKNYFYGGRSFF